MNTSQIFHKILCYVYIRFSHMNFKFKYILRHCSTGVSEKKSVYTFILGYSGSLLSLDFAHINYKKL